MAESRPRKVGEYDRTMTRFSTGTIIGILVLILALIILAIILF